MIFYMCQITLCQGSECYITVPGTPKNFIYYFAGLLVSLQMGHLSCHMLNSCLANDRLVVS